MTRQEANIIRDCFQDLMNDIEAHIAYRVFSQETIDRIANRLSWLAPNPIFGILGSETKPKKKEITPILKVTKETK